MQVNIIITNRDFPTAVSKKKMVILDCYVKRTLVQGNYCRRARLATRNICKTCLVTVSTRLTTRSTCSSTRLFTGSTRFSTRSTRFSIRRTCLSIRLSIRSTRLSALSIRLSTRSICLSPRSTHSTICRSFYN